MCEVFVLSFSGGTVSPFSEIRGFAEGSGGHQAGRPRWACFATLAMIAIGKKATGTIATCYLENSQRVTLIPARVSKLTKTWGGQVNAALWLGLELNWLHLRVHIGSMLRCVGKVAEAARMWWTAAPWVVR